VPDNVRKLNGVLRYSQGTATDGFTLSAMAYSNGWNSTDQVALRAIRERSAVRLKRAVLADIRDGMGLIGRNGFGPGD
jgi:hypothetical protein